MEIEYQIFKEDNLLINSFIGEFSIDYWQDYYYMLIKTQEWKYVEKVIVNLRNAKNLSSILDKISKLHKFRSDVIQKKFSTILLVDSPDATASSCIYVKKIKENYRYNYCSTNEYALDFLNLNKNSSELQIMINNLENRF